MCTLARGFMRRSCENKVSYYRPIMQSAKVKNREHMQSTEEDLS